MPSVKGEGRKERAAQTRRRMLDAAYGLFTTEGFRATSMTAIAERAAVAVQTLYFTFHTKDELLQEVQDRAVIGEDRIPPHHQAWFRAMISARTMRTSVEHFADGTADILSRVAPLIPTMHEVAGDPAGEVWRRSERLRREGYAEIIRAWAARASLRPDLDEDHAVDLLLVLAGPEVYRSLVVEYRWPTGDYVAWLGSAILRDLFAKR